MGRTVYGTVDSCQQIFRANRPVCHAFRTERTVPSRISGASTASRKRPEIVAGTDNRALVAHGSAGRHYLASNMGVPGYLMGTALHALGQRRPSAPTVSPAPPIRSADIRHSPAPRVTAVAPIGGLPHKFPAEYRGMSAGESMLPGDTRAVRTRVEYWRRDQGAPRQHSSPGPLKGRPDDRQGN